MNHNPVRQAVFATTAAIICAAMAASAAESPRPAAVAKAPSPAPAVEVKTGLAALLAEDEKVVSELASRDLASLRDYMFNKLKYTEDQRKVFLAISLVKQLDKPNLTSKERGRIIRDVSAGIAGVVAQIKDPAELLRINKQLVDFGTKRALNVMEYWPANPKTQAQVRPVAEAVDRVYAAAIEIAQKQAKDIEGRMNAGNQHLLGPQWEKLENLIGLARFSRAFNLYTVALSMDKSDARRVDIAKMGIEILTEYEDPSFEIQDQCRVGLGKLWMVAGPETIGQAKNKFGEVLKSPKATWGQKFEAVYFTAVTDLLDGKPAEARKGKAAVEAWLKSHPPEGDAKTAEETKKGVEAAIDMLEYRILSFEADKATGPAKEKANTDAIAVLDRLAKARPDLEGIINEQMMAKLPENPDIKSLNNRLLHALASRGNEELAKPEGQPTDKRAIELAAAAAREIVSRSGKEGVAPEDVENSLLLVAYCQLKLGKTTEAANTFLDFVKQYPRSQNLETAFDSAMSLTAKLQREQADARSTQEIYVRFLEVATAPPFNRKQFNLEYAQLLLRRNLAAMESDYDDAKRQAMLAQTKKAAALCAAVGNEENRAIYAKFNEMMAIDQMIDLDSRSKEVPARIARMQALAGELNALIEKQSPGATGDQARVLKVHKVQANLLVANITKHIEGEGRKAGMEQALALLANFEKDVEGMANADALLGEVRLIRVNFLMALGRASEALADLQKFVETAGDRGIDVIATMLDALDKDFKQALKNQDIPEATSLAGNRAQVSSFLVERVAASKNEKLRALLPQYKAFQASANLNAAALLDKNDPKRPKLLESALTVYEPIAATELPEGADAKERERVNTAKLNVGYIHYELGNYLKTRSALADLLAAKTLGTPRSIQGVGAEQVVKWNDSYWGATLKLMWCDVKLVEQKAPGYDEKTLDETRTYLKRLYIQWGEPGGPKWAPEFDKLREALLPGWTPPPLEDAPATQPAAVPGK